MKDSFILIKNIALQSNAPQAILEAIEDVHYDLDETLQALKEGEIS